MIDQTSTLRVIWTCCSTASWHFQFEKERRPNAAHINAFWQDFLNTYTKPYGLLFLSCCWALLNMCWKICRSFAVHLLSSFWAMPQHLLSTRWVFTEHILSACWALAERLLSACWELAEHLLSTCWALSEYLLSTYRALAESLLNTYWVLAEP